jgi:hypothetical protein
MTSNGAPLTLGQKAHCWNCRHLSNTDGDTWVDDFKCAAYQRRFPVYGRPFPVDNCPRWEKKLGQTVLSRG